MLVITNLAFSMKVDVSVEFNNTQVAFLDKSDSELSKSHKLFKLVNNQALVSIGSRLAKWGLSGNFFAKSLIRNTIYEQFCGGENLQEVQNVVNDLKKFNVQTFLDYGVEAKEGEEEFNKTVAQLTKALEFAANDAFVPAISCKITGLGRFSLLQHYNTKKTIKKKHLHEWKQLEERLHTICKVAHTHKVAIYFDAEESWIQDALDMLIMKMMEIYNQKFPIVYNTIQLYRHDKLAYLKECHQTAKEKKYLLAVKLVRGAYMEKERARAIENNYPSPIQPNKEACDQDFNEALKYCIENIEDIVFCNASHNEISNQYVCQLMTEHELDANHPHITFAQLYGMSNHISFNLAKKGYNVAKYLPYGPVKDVIPYLIRRAKENSSASGQISRELGLIEAEMKRRKSKK